MTQQSNTDGSSGTDGLEDYQGQPRPGMKPVELLFKGNDKNVCTACGREFETWQGAHDHQEYAHGEYLGIEHDRDDLEDWIDETETFDWWVTYPEERGIVRETLELHHALDMENHGCRVSLAEPIRGGPAGLPEGDDDG